MLLKRLAVGGMAELFLATDSQTNDLVAIKRILPYLSGEADFVRMFLSEARIAAQLHHPNIVQVFELGKLEESIFLAMEYVEGTDLRRVLQQQAKVGVNIPYGVAARVIADISKGLHYAHNSMGVEGRALEIVHRDVSPQNVMVAFDGRVKLVDFGIAKANAYMEASKPGVIKGKFLYLSPEQVVQDRVDHRADLFALGTVLYEITTGKSPFLKPTSEAVIYAIKSEDPMPPQRFRGDFPEGLRRIIMKCLEKDRSRRYTQASEIEADLEQFLEDTDRTDATVVSAYLDQLFGEENERTALHIPRAKRPPPLPPRAVSPPTPPPPPSYPPRPSIVAMPVLEPMPRRMTGEMPRRTSGLPSVPPPPPVEHTPSGGGSDIRTMTVSTVSPGSWSTATSPLAPPPTALGARAPASEEEGPTASLRPHRELPPEVSTRRERPPEGASSATPAPASTRLEDLEPYNADSEAELTELAMGGEAERILKELQQRNSSVTQPSTSSSASGPIPTPTLNAATFSASASTSAAAGRITAERPSPTRGGDSEPVLDAPVITGRGTSRSQRPASNPPRGGGTPGKGASRPRKPVPEEERTRTFVAEFTHSGITFVRRRLRSTMAAWATAGALVAIIVVSLYRLNCEPEQPHAAIVSRQVPATAAPAAKGKSLAARAPVLPPAAAAAASSAVGTSAGPPNVVFQAPKGTLVLANGQALSVETPHVIRPGVLHYEVLCPGAPSRTSHTAEIPAPTGRPTVVVVPCSPNPSK